MDILLTFIVSVRINCVFFCHLQLVSRILDLHMTEGLSLLYSMPSPVMELNSSLGIRLYFIHVEH